MSHEEPSSYLSINDRFPKIGNDNLSALEECFFIGGSAKIGEVVVNTGEIKKECIPDYLKPRNLLEGGSIEDVNQERSRGYIRGFLPFFEYQGSRALADKGLEVALKIPPVDPDAGVMPREWQVVIIPSLYDGENLDDDVLQDLMDQNVEYLAIRESDRSMFELESRDSSVILRMI